jgi:hypothetical protein
MMAAIKQAATAYFALNIDMILACFFSCAFGSGIFAII